MITISLFVAVFEALIQLKSWTFLRGDWLAVTPAWMDLTAASSAVFPTKVYLSDSIHASDSSANLQFFVDSLGYPFLS